MVNSIFVSILMASHNREKYISAAIESVLRQNYTNLELFIIDDCSTDNSWQIIQSFARQHAQIRISKNATNQGVGFTKKRLLDEAKGDILFVLDADDAIAKDAIAKCVQLHENHPDVSLVYTDHYICDENLNPIPMKSISRPIPKQESHLTFHSIGHLVSVKKSYYQRISGLNPDYQVAVDQDFYYQMEEVGKILFLNEKLYYYRHNAFSISLNNNKFEAVKQKIAIMREAKQRRIRHQLKVKYPSENDFYLLEWYADYQLGRGNIKNALVFSFKELNFKIPWLIAKYHAKIFYITIFDT